MKNSKQKLIIVISILFMLVLSPVLNATENTYVTPFDEENDIEYIYDHRTYDYEIYEPYTEPISIVKAGGPYETVIGTNTIFSGFFLSSYFANVTGYTWNFGDGTSMYHEFDPIINAESEISIECPATHKYSSMQHYTATLRIHHDTQDFTPLRDYPKYYDINREIVFTDQDTAQVSIISQYDDWNDLNELPSSNENNFVKQIWRESSQSWVDEYAGVDEEGPIRFRLTYDPSTSVDDVTVKDYLPATVRYVSATPAPTTVLQKIYFDNFNDEYVPYTLLTWDFGDISSSYNIDIEIEGVVEYLNKTYFNLPDDHYPIKYLTRNYAEFRGTGRSPGCGNRYSIKYGADATFDINPVQHEPDIEIKKYVKFNCCGTYNDIGITATRDDWVTFKLEVSNNGDVPLDVRVTDHLPAGLTYDNSATVDGVPQEPVFIDDHNFYWDLGILDVDQKVLIYFRAQVDECGTLTNIAVANGTYQETTYSDDDSATVTVDCQSGVSIEKQVREECSDTWQEHVDVGLGDEVVFRLLVENTGQTTLDLIVTDTLPDNLIYISGSANYTPFSVSGGRTITWIFYEVPPSSDPIEIIFRAQAVELGFGENWGYVNDECQSAFDEDNATVDVISDSPGVKLTKTILCDHLCEPVPVGTPDDSENPPVASPFADGDGWCKTKEVDIGDTVLFNLTVEYIPGCGYKLTDIIVTDILPNCLEFTGNARVIFDGVSTPGYSSVSGQTIYWNLTEDFGVELFDSDNLKFVYIEFSATAVECTDECGEENQAFVDALETCCHVERRDYDYATVIVNCPPDEPDLEVEKTVKWNCCGQYSDTGIMVSMGDWVTFRLNVTNTGNTPLDIRIKDSLPIGLIYDNHATPREYDEMQTPLNGHIEYLWYFDDVQPGENVVVTFRAIPDECGELINEVNVTGTYDQLPPVYGEDSVFVFVSCPDINIVKEANPTEIFAGDLVTYTYTVTNIGNVPLRNIVVTDDQGLVPVYVSGDTNGDDWLNLSETWVYQVTANPMDDVCNIGNVSGEDQYCTVVYDEDDACIRIMRPDIKVTKTVSAIDCIEPGEQVTWNITVENTGNVLLNNIYVVDDNIGVLDSMISLFSGEKKYYEYSTNPTEATTNVVDVNGIDPLGREVTDSDSASVEICEPDIDLEVEKQAKRNCNGIYGHYIYVEKGFWATFKIIVENTGGSTLDIQVCDTLPDGLSYAGYPQVNGVPIDPVDMCWTINDVEPGEKITILFRVDVDECGEHVNTVVVTGFHDQLEPIVKQDTATIFTICPDINVVKTADSNLVSPGDLVTYTYEVTNTGNHHLKNVVLTDDKIPGVTYVSGDTNSDDWLDLDETWIYTASANLFEDTTNTANVSAEDEMDRKVYDEDTEFVDVEECPPPELGIEVVKYVKKNCCGGYTDSILKITADDWITFKLEVTNTGDLPLDIVVVDTLPIGLAYNDNAKVDGSGFIPGVSGNEITFDLGTVGSGETVVITFEATVNCQTCGELINRVNVTGTYDQEPPVFDEDQVSVFVLCPDINIVKTASPTLINPGQLVTYTYEVTNTGNTPLTNIVVEDDQGLVPVYVSGDTNGDDWLNLSETWVYEVSDNIYEDTTNVGSVTGEDELSQSVYDEDDAFVDVEECGCTPSISIDKKILDGQMYVDDLEIVGEGPVDVTFKIIVENTGTCDLENITIIDTMQCGIEDPRDITGVTQYVENPYELIFNIPGILTSLDDPIVITFNATVYISSANNVTVDADSIDEVAHLSEEDQVTITFDLPGVNHAPYKPITPEPEDAAENVSVNPTLGVYVEDPDDDSLTVYFYDASDDSEIGNVTVSSGTRAETVWNSLEFETGYSWYAVADDGEFINTSDDFSFTTKADTGDYPTVNITRPLDNSIYFRNIFIPASFLKRTIIIGPINITAEADDVDGNVTSVEFFIDGDLKNTSTDSPYYYNFNEIYFGVCTITVKATDDMNNTAEDTIEVFVINLGLAK